MPDIKDAVLQNGRASGTLVLSRQTMKKRVITIMKPFRQERTKKKKEKKKKEKKAGGGGGGGGGSKHFTI